MAHCIKGIEPPCIFFPETMLSMHPMVRYAPCLFLTGKCVRALWLYFPNDLHLANRYLDADGYDVSVRCCDPQLRGSDSTSTDTGKVTPPPTRWALSDAGRHRLSYLISLAVERGITRADVHRSLWSVGLPCAQDEGRGKFSRWAAGRRHVLDQGKHRF